jgi:hypothetical protein
MPGWRSKSPLSLACYYGRKLNPKVRNYLLTLLGHVRNVLFLLDRDPLIKVTEAADCVRVAGMFSASF